MPNAVQGKFWCATIPVNDWNPPSELPASFTWIKGQQEIGDGGYHHWQIVFCSCRKLRLLGAKALLCQSANLSLSRSQAANDYVWKEETAVAGTRFELGRLPMKRNSEKDWEKIWEDSKAGNVEAIPPDVRMRCYHTIKRIRKDYERAPMRPDIVVNVFWGVTGSGKSHKAFQLAEAEGPYYVKGSTTKWWDGYKGEKVVIMDEFRGQISVEHLLKWFDKYPCYVEEKGGQLSLNATTFYVCSNLNPRDWFKDIDDETRRALLRRLRIREFCYRYNFAVDSTDDTINDLINLPSF